MYDVCIIHVCIVRAYLCVSTFLYLLIVLIVLMYSTHALMCTLYIFITVKVPYFASRPNLATFGLSVAKVLWYAMRTPN